MSSKTSDIGVIGELAVMAHLIELEYEVFKGITGAESADLIAYKNGMFTRVQVKCRSSKNNVVVFPRAYGGHSDYVVLQGHEFDVLAMYVRDKRLCLFMNIKEVIENQIGTSVRFIAPKNGAKKNVRMYEEYISFDRARM